MQVLTYKVKKENLVKLKTFLKQNEKSINAKRRRTRVK